MKKINLPKQLIRDINSLLKRVVKDKIKKYKPETENKPFHYRLIGKDRYAMFSFIHSMNTTFGMSVFEQMGVLIAKNYDFEVERNYKLVGSIDSKTEQLINRLHHNLRQGKEEPNISHHTSLIRESLRKVAAVDDPDRTVDLFIKKANEENYFDITSAKPNMKEFAALKRKLLRWTGLRLSQNKKAKVFSRLGIPYNPYYPEQYERWTLKGLYDLKEGEILIGKEFWNFLANEKIYDELLNLVENIGKDLRPELDKFFEKFK